MNTPHEEPKVVTKDGREWSASEIEQLISDLVGLRNDLASKGHQKDSTTVTQAVVLLDILAERRKRKY